MQGILCCLLDLWEWLLCDLLLWLLPAAVPLGGNLMAGIVFELGWLGQENVSRGRKTVKKESSRQKTEFAKGAER